jgi:hypothetical protein
MKWCWAIVVKRHDNIMTDDIGCLLIFTMRIAAEYWIKENINLPWIEDAIIQKIKIRRIKMSKNK